MNKRIITILMLVCLTIPGITSTITGKITCQMEKKHSRRPGNSPEAERSGLFAHHGF